MAALGVQGYLAIVEKQRNAAVLLVYYFAMLIPWIFITRTVFIYQYFTCTQALILMISASMAAVPWKNRKHAIFIVAVVSLALFLLFFPVISGLPVRRAFVDNCLKWFPRWVF